MRFPKNIKSFHLRMKPYPTGERSPAQLQTKTSTRSASSRSPKWGRATQLNNWNGLSLLAPSVFASRAPPHILSFISPKRELVKERSAYEKLSPHRNLSLKQNTDFLDGLRAYFCTQADRTKWPLPSTRNLSSRYDPKNTGLSA